MNDQPHSEGRAPSDEDSQDPRVGDKVVSRDGKDATIQHVDGASDRVTLAWASGETVEIPASLLQSREGGIFALPMSGSALQELITSSRDAVEITIPVVEEEATLQKRERTTGRVRIDKQVHDRKVQIDEAVRREEVHVERVPIDRFVDEPVAPYREGNTLVIPVLEEVLVVERRLKVVEEVRVTMQERHERVQDEITLRREEVTVKREET